MKKKFQYDGKSRPSNDLYKKNFEIIFGKKIDKNKEELEGYYIDGKKEGAWVSWFGTGIKSSEGAFTENERKS